jgi:GTPase
MEERKRKQFLLISIISKSLSDIDALKDLRELKALVETYGGEVADLIVQRREMHEKGNYMGKGKIYEAVNLIAQRKIDIIILNATVKTGQIYEMKSTFMISNKFIEVWDRVDLILQIFKMHAHTAEARLQIELAAMRHMGPRIYGMGMVLSKQAGGIGTRGVGETNTELMKRHWQELTKKVQGKLDKLVIVRKQQIDKRSRAGLITISCVGYTNAGKTSLFNLLTKKKKLIADALFVTLDSTVGKLYLPKMHREILVSDTIGFIKNLPTQLIDAFRSTLLEAINANLLLLIIDVADSEMSRKIETVENILSELNLQEKKRIYVFNKIDKVDSIDKVNITLRYQKHPLEFISVKTGEGIDSLLSTIEKELESINHNEEINNIYGL